MMHTFFKKNFFLWYLPFVLLIVIGICNKMIKHLKID